MKEKPKFVRYRVWLSVCNSSAAIIFETHMYFNASDNYEDKLDLSGHDSQNSFCTYQNLLVLVVLPNV